MLFKYAIYLSLLGNVYFFFREDLETSRHLFGEEVGLGQLISAFAQFIDTFFWFVLLMMFELETFVIPDRVLKKAVVKGSLMAVRFLCYGFIVYAFYGYITKLLMSLNVTPLGSVEPCSLVHAGYSILLNMDDYLPLTMETCRQLTAPFYQVGDQLVITDHAKLMDTRGLAVVDVLNAGAWIGVVVILEVDVWLQLKGMYEGMVLRVSTIFKVVVYGILLMAAIYWGFLGDFLDFWDAFLWIMAFVFIEMNLFKWHEHTSHPETVST
tara:strand:- start:616 stop:1416 length:801 start_codon:yes stop_codon:yes gene_type:complete